MMSAKKINRSLRLLALADEVEALSVKLAETLKRKGVAWK
jgi:hypothetical protein